MKQRVSLFIFIFLTACASAPALDPPAETLSSPHLVIETLTPSPVPTITLTPSPTPTIEEWISSFTIKGLRQHDFQSGEIHIRSTLDENDKYTSYLIDYPSDGLTITGVMQIPMGAGPFPVIVMNHGFFSRGVWIHHHRLRLSKLGRFGYRGEFLLLRLSNRCDQLAERNSIYRASRYRSHWHVGS